MEKNILTRLYDYRNFITTISSGFIIAAVALSEMFDTNEYTNLLIVSIIGFSLSVIFGLFSYKNLLQFEMNDSNDINELGKIVCNGSEKRMKIYGNLQHIFFLLSFICFIIYLTKNILN